MEILCCQFDIAWEAKDRNFSRVAPFICFDLRFPEVFRLAVRRGAQVALVLANWPDRRIRHWVSLLQARAIENQMCVAGVNRSGSDPGLKVRQEGHAA